jgi:hypothetical protein
VSDAVVVGLIAGGAAVVSAALAALASMYHRRTPDAIASETRQIVAEIRVTANGKLNEALAKIAELERVIKGRPG